MDDLSPSKDSLLDRLGSFARLDRMGAQTEDILIEQRRRIGRSLYMIGAILLRKADREALARNRGQLETRDIGQETAAILRHLDMSFLTEKVEIGQYLRALCKSLSASLIGDGSVTIGTRSDAGSATAEMTVCYGLLVTELCMNALKHAFPDNVGAITVKYRARGARWHLCVTDNGTGYRPHAKDSEDSGVVYLLSKHLRANLKRKSNRLGTTISLTWMR